MTLINITVVLCGLVFLLHVIYLITVKSLAATHMPADDDRPLSKISTFFLTTRNITAIALFVLVIVDLVLLYP